MTAVRKTEEHRNEWRNAPLNKMTSNAHSALQDLLSILPEDSTDLMETIFGDDAYEDNDIVKSMLEKKKSTIH